MPPVEHQVLDAFRDFLAGVEDEVARRFVDGVDWSLPLRQLPPRTLPCLRHLRRTAEIAPDRAGRTAKLLAHHAAELNWGQTYTAKDFGKRFLGNYGWMELFGTRGHFASAAIAGGFLLLGPHTTYPDHHHIAEEIYIPLTGGTLWRMGDEPFRQRAANEVIHHRSNVSHAMRTLDEPLLALYLWRGGDLAQRSTISAAPGAHSAEG